MPRVSLETKNLVFEVEENEIVFDALDNQGETLPHGCLSGSCGACRIEVCKGHENLAPMSAMEQNTVEAITEYLTKTKGEDYMKGRPLRLACRARVLGDITIKPYK